MNPAVVVKQYPALSFTAVLGAISALVIALWPGITQVEGAYVGTIVVGVGSLLAWWGTTKRPIAGLTGFAATVLTGLTAFDVKVPADVLALVVAVVTFVGGHFLHAAVSSRLS